MIKPGVLQIVTRLGMGGSARPRAEGPLAVSRGRIPAPNFSFLARPSPPNP